MTLIPKHPMPAHQLPPGWQLSLVRPADIPELIAFLTATPRLAGKKSGAAPRDIEELIASAIPGEAQILRGPGGSVAALSLLHSQHGDAPEILSTLLTLPDLVQPLADHLLAAQLGAFQRHGAALGPAAHLRFIQGDRQQPVVQALLRHGARIETRFYRFRRSLAFDDEGALARAFVPGYRLLSWAEALESGLSEAVRQLQYTTFKEHFGNMSKTAADWPHYIGNPAFAPDFSFALIHEASGAVAGYALASLYTDDSGPALETLPHIDYIGIRPDLRGQGLAKLILQKFWLEALLRGHQAVSLGSDIFNRTGAVWLYLGQGYAPVEHLAAYRFDLTDAAILRAAASQDLQ
ncbi:GNAT family N-acetyltransferase [Xinfangfangia sp. D13-10-4-6]|uniref:GNAT family N-acetyltransferase n=1 Tax=Pseudogemmobacter hezensis TaxID=2737662 RepID=UPI0015576B72|nr:GNAT family N-acetyltransferase [Pseudogemmobacter hezensis]NPD14864.1 GNAT family N-acetyltransferase [Pseudogemmobacter hezensis]